MVNLHILALENPQKCQITYKKELKTLVFGSFLTKSVISVNVDACVRQNLVFEPIFDSVSDDK